MGHKEAQFDRANFQDPSTRRRTPTWSGFPRRETPGEPNQQCTHRLCQHLSAVFIPTPPRHPHNSLAASVRGRVSRRRRAGGGRRLRSGLVSRSRGGRAQRFLPGDYAPGVLERARKLRPATRETSRRKAEAQRNGRGPKSPDGRSEDRA